MNPLSTLINDSLQRFEELLSLYMKNFKCQCETCKHYHISDCTKNLGCNACHPRFISSHLTQSQLSIIQAMKKKVDATLKYQQLDKPEELQDKAYNLGVEHTVTLLSSWLQEAEDLISKKKK